MSVVNLRISVILSYPHFNFLSFKFTPFKVFVFVGFILIFSKRNCKVCHEILPNNNRSEDKGRVDLALDNIMKCPVNRLQTLCFFSIGPNVWVIRTSM